MVSKNPQEKIEQIEGTRGRISKIIATASLILGCLSVCAMIALMRNVTGTYWNAFFFANLLCGLASIIAATISFITSRQRRNAEKGTAIAGLIVGIIGVLPIVVFLLLMSVSNV